MQLSPASIHPAPLEPAETIPGTDRPLPSLPATRRSPFRAGWILAIVALGDFAAASAALWLAWWLRFHTGLSRIGTYEADAVTATAYLGHVWLGAIVMSLGLIRSRAYEALSLLHARRELKVVAKATLVWLMAYLTLTLFLRFEPVVSRIYCVIAPVCLFAVLSYWRLLVTHCLVPGHLGKALRRRILLVGWNPESHQVASFASWSRNPEYEILGVLLPGPELPQDVPPPRDWEVLGTYDDLEPLLRQGPFDAVLVGDLNLDSDRLRDIAALCEKEMVDFELIPTCFPALHSGLSLHHVGGVPILGVTRLPLHSPFNQAVKRLVDIAGAVVGLVISAPVIAVLAVLIYRESPGPVFFRQRRMGIRGQRFEMIKLRSMKLGAYQGPRPGWTVKDDPRRLRIGKRMRSWNLDELPQFWNVLKGDMSLVGPRPEDVEVIREFKEVIPHYNARHHVKPGITGWAQVHGLRGDTDLVERIRHDLHYIEHWSLWLDFRIMVMTLLTRKGAC